MARQKRLKPKPKQDKKSWQKRNYARSTLQDQYASAKRAEEQLLDPHAEDYRYDERA